MRLTKRGRMFGTAGHALAAWIATLAFILPIYIALSSAFKTQAQIVGNPLALPIPFTFDNIVGALGRSDHLVVSGLLNSLFVTGVSLAILIPLSSALSFYISERGPVLKSILLAVFAMGLMIPPQVVLLPIVQLLQSISLAHTYPGLILSNVGGGYLSFAVFVYVGFGRPDGRGLGRTRAKAGREPVRPRLRLPDEHGFTDHVGQRPAQSVHARPDPALERRGGRARASATRPSTTCASVPWLFPKAGCPCSAGTGRTTGASGTPALPARRL